MKFYGGGERTLARSGRSEQSFLKDDILMDFGYPFCYCACHSSFQLPIIIIFLLFYYFVQKSVFFFFFFFFLYCFVQIQLKKNLSKKLVSTTIIIRRKCTFNSYILNFFHFGPYILILPLLVSKPINACYFRHSVSQPTEIAKVAAGAIKIL